MPRSVSFTSNYSDPLRAMTIKALQARQLELAKADEQRKMPEIRSPLQGAAYVADIFADTFDRNATSRAEGANRDELARLQAGIDPNKPIDAQTLAAMARLDPEFGKFGFERNFSLADSLRERAAKEADALRTHGWNVDDREDDQQAARDLAAQAQAAAADESQKGRDATSGENRLNREATSGENRLNREADATTREDTQAEARTTAETLAKTAAEKAANDAKLRAAEPQTEAAKLTADYNAGRFGPVGSPEAKAILADAIKKETSPPPQTASNIAAKAKLSDELLQTRSTLNDLDEALKLAPDVFEGRLAKVRMNAVLAAPGQFDPETVRQAQATQRYFQIMDMNAITTMSRTLSGADSDRDVSNFLQILADPMTPLNNKRIQIQNMIAKGKAREKAQADYVSEANGDPNVGTGGAGGDGGGAPAMPQTQADFDALPSGAAYIDPDDPNKRVQHKN